MTHYKQIGDRAKTMGIDPIYAILAVKRCKDRGGYNLNIAKLVEFPEYDFAHDVMGIIHNITDGGQLKDDFLPRCCD